jgi:hypothetical protein
MSMGTIALLILALAAQTAPAPPSGPPPATLCHTAQHGQFDFWVGQWDVYRADTNQLVAHSLIEKLYGGCAVRENWMPLGGTGGGSLNSYRPASKQWEQYWTDSGNNLNVYIGGLQDSKMVLTGVSHSANGADSPARMVYEKLPDGSVTQTGYTSSDSGKTWQLSYKLVYRHAAQH